MAIEADAAPAVTRPRMLQEGAYKPKERVMVATQGNPRLIDFALKECKSRQAELQLLFIRHLAVTPMGPASILGNGKRRKSGRPQVGVEDAAA